MGTDTDAWPMSFGRITDPEIQLSTPDGSSQNLTYALLKQDKDLWSFFPNKDAIGWKENHFYEFGEDVDCQKLRAKSIEVLKKIDDKRLCRDGEEKLNLDSNVDDISDVLNHALKIKVVNNEEVSKGKNIARNICSQCHSGSFEQMNFFKSDETLKKRVLEKEGFRDLIIDKITSGDMPLNSTLKISEQKDLIKYIESFTREIDTP